MILDAVTRLIPGALGNEDSAVNESFTELEATGQHEDSQRPDSVPSPRKPPKNSPAAFSIAALPRPPSFRGWDVPEVLLGGNHEEIRRSHRKKALERTLKNRPDLLVGTALGDEDQRFLREIKS